MHDAGPIVRFARTEDGVSIAWASTGDGPPLVLMPSLPLGNLTGEWRVPVHREVYLRLAGSVRLIQYDGRGTGRSEREVSDLSPEAMLRDLEAVVAAAGLERFALMGMYLSVVQAIAYALRQPQRVSHLILFGGAARGSDPMDARQTQALLSLMEQDWDTFVESAFHAWLGWDAGEDGRLQVESARESTTPAIARAMLEASGNVDLTDRLGEVRQPALVFHQRGVRQMPLELSQALAAALPNGRLCVLEGATASLFVRGSERFIDELTSFLEVALPREDADDRPERGAGPAAAAAGSTSLTAREVEVLRLLAQGETNAGIADELTLSVHTVERHLANIYRKIDARGRADATAYAIRRGLA